MITLSFWYKNIPIKKIKKDWIDLIPLLGVDRVGKKEGSGSWDYVAINNISVFFGISERIEHLVCVDIHSRDDDLLAELEIILKKFYELQHYSQPAEAFLLEGVEEDSGLLFILASNGIDLDKYLKGIEPPQIRVINKSVYENLAELAQVAKKYTSNSVVTRDNVWLDFGWSEFSSTWNINGRYS